MGCEGSRYLGVACAFTAAGIAQVVAKKAKQGIAIFFIGVF
jgi:hypothetical protein